MQRFLRVFRASAVLGGVWAAVWGLLGFGLALFNLSEPFPFTAIGLLGFLTGSSAALGFLGGSTFSLALAALQHRMSLDRLNPLMVGIAGAIGGGAAIPALAVAFELLTPGTSVLVDAATVTAFGAFGAVSAVATLAVAKAGADLPAGDRSPILPGS